LAVLSLLEFFFAFITCLFCSDNARLLLFHQAFIEVINLPI